MKYDLIKSIEKKRWCFTVVTVKIIEKRAWNLCVKFLVGKKENLLANKINKHKICTKSLNNILWKVKILPCSHHRVVHRC